MSEVVNSPKNAGLAVAAMVLGIVGFFVDFFVWGIPSILAIIFGHVALSKIKREGLGGRGMAIAGLATGYTALTITLFWYFVFAAALAGSTTVS